VVCGDRQTAAHDAHAVENPSLVAEVMSPSSRDKDQGTKSQAYRQLPTVQEILLIDSEARFVVHQQRQDDGSWRLTEHRDADRLTLALGVELTLDELYDGTGI
jgi:Uma2 family endonuclease